MSSTEQLLRRFDLRSNPMAQRDIVKRAGDLFLLAIAALPVLVVIAMLYLVVRRDGGPGFFGHERVGQDGRTFRCWKLRSMVPDAAAVLERHLAEDPDAAAEWARDFKLENDPRITRLGRVLRRTSLDELPQLWNILLGQMSFVGPRPVTREELDKYRGYEWCYLTMRPGLTGLWQVSGRNDVDYAGRVQLDAQYASTWSAAGDLKIVLRTVNAVLSRTGR